MPLNADDAIVPPPNSAYEFDATAAAESGPAPSSDAPGSVEEPPQQTSEREQPEQGSVSDGPREFDQRAREPFIGLLWIGHLERTFSVFGHAFRIVTPSREERLQMALVCRPYQDTASFELAWQAAMVAGYLTHVDGEPLPEPVSRRSTETPFSERFDWVVKNLRDPVIDEVFTKCLELNGEVDRALDAMGKAQG